MRYDTFKGIPKNKGWCFSGHCITLAKVSNDILIGFTDQGDLGNNILQDDYSFEDNRI